MAYLNLVVWTSWSPGDDLDPPVLVEGLEPLAALLDLLADLPVVAGGPLHELNVEGLLLPVNLSLDVLDEGDGLPVPLHPHDL